MNGMIRRSLAVGTGLALSTLLGAVAWPQNQPAAQPGQPSAQQSQPSAQSAPQPQRTIQMVQAQALLDKTMDTKKAKQGDPVAAKLVQGVQIPDAVGTAEEHSAGRACGPGAGFRSQE